MIIVHSTGVYAVTKSWLYTDRPAPPGGVAVTYVPVPATYRGEVTGWADASRQRVVRTFTFDSPVEQSTEGLKPVLDWLVTDLLAGGTVMEAPRQPDVMELVGGVWTVNPAKLEAKLVALCKKQAEAARMKVQSPGAAKATVYAAKAREVAAWDAMGSTEALRRSAYAALTLVLRQTIFTYAVAEAAASGEADVSAAIGRMRSGAAAGDGEAARLEAIEQISCRAIKSASTAAAKQSAFDAINWTWKQ